MNKITQEMVDKIRNLFDEYMSEDIQADELRKDINEMIDNRV